MTTSERSRHELYAKLEAMLGRKDADTMMQSLLPVTFDELATKTDLDQLRVATKTDLDHLRVAINADVDQRLAEFKAEMRAEMTQLRTGISADIESLRHTTTSDMLLLRAELHDSLRRQTWQMMAAVFTMLLSVLAVGQVG